VASIAVVFVPSLQKVFVLTALILRKESMTGLYLQNVISDVFNKYSVSAILPVGSTTVVVPFCFSVHWHRPQIRYARINGCFVTQYSECDWSQ
jgi:hypothetical protein